MKADELKSIREEFDFTQSFMAEILGIHLRAYQKMEYGSSPIPTYIKNYALCFKLLNENMLFRKHIANIGVEIKEDKEELP